MIHYRSLLYALNARGYWDNGGYDSEFRSNKDVLREHDQHIDLKDVLSAYQSSAAIRLEEIASLCGFPGSMGTQCGEKGQGARVWKTWLGGDIGSIRADCESTVLNTYLVYLNWMRNRGHLDQQQYEAQCGRVREELKSSTQIHLVEFEKNWIDL